VATARLGSLIVHSLLVVFAPMVRHFALVAVVVAGCKDNPHEASVSASSASSTTSATRDAGAPADAEVWEPPIEKERRDPALLPDATAYVEKLRKVAPSIKAAKKPPAKCPKDLASTLPEADRTTFVFDYADLQDMAGMKVNFNIDPTSFMLQLISQSVSDLHDVHRFATKERKDRPYMFGGRSTLRPLAVVVKVDHVDVPQIAERKQYWPGVFKGSIFLVEVATAKVLCGGKLAFGSPRKLDVARYSLTDKSGNAVGMTFGDDPGQAVTKDFIERGRKAITAFVAKQAPELQLPRWAR
jgi:hypothetical protein